MKNAQSSLHEPSVTISCTASCPFLPCPTDSLASPFFFVSPSSFFASAPPCNHFGSWLSFGVVYIAVIVRVQYGDWAVRVYSLTVFFRCKSYRGEERTEVGRHWGNVRAQGHAHTRKNPLAHMFKENKTAFNKCD